MIYDTLPAYVSHQLRRLRRAYTSGRLTWLAYRRLTRAVMTEHRDDT